MKKTLKDLWYGNISPNEERYIDETVRKKLIAQYFAYDEKLKTILSQEERDMVEKREDVLSQISSYHESEAFVSGFRLGAKMMLEVLEND